MLDIAGYIWERVNHVNCNLRDAIGRASLLYDLWEQQLIVVRLL